MLEIIKKLEADYKVARVLLKEQKKATKRATRHAANVLKAQVFVQGVSQAIQQQAHEQISKVVSRCLDAVFDDPYEFKIIFEKKRGRTEARLAFLKDGEEVHPTDGAGGGMVDVAALALRLAALMLQRPRRRRVLIMDEPFKNINGEAYQKRAGALIEALAQEMNFQFIIVTDDDWLKVGKIIQL